MKKGIYLLSVSMLMVIGANQVTFAQSFNKIDRPIGLQQWLPTFQPKAAAINQWLNRYADADVPVIMSNRVVASTTGPPMPEDQQILDDLIVVGSACVGQDCVNGYSFGFSTLVLRENNLRIRFEDTSNSSSFPTNDWQLTANDASNGGANKFSIDDIDHGRTPFTVEAGARSNALYVDDGGKIGLGTSTPVVRLHMKDGNTPTMRLEQDGTSGFAQQTWDVAGNEANFFVRDASNGSTLPFRIFPAAPTNSLTVATGGNVGIGTSSPTVKLAVHNGNINLTNSGAHSDPEIRIWSDDGLVTSSFRIRDLSAGQLRMDKRTAAGSSTIDFNPLPLDNSGSASFRFFRNSNTSGAVFVSVHKGDNTGTINSQLGGNTDTYFAADNGSVGIGTNAPGYLLHVDGDAAKPSGGSWTVASDARLKKDVKEFTDGLALLNKIEPKTFKYNGKAGIKTTEKQVGVIAQDLKKIAPYMVSEYKAADGKEYLAVNPGALDYVLINAVKEQQETIVKLEEKLNRKDERINSLETKVDALVSQMIQFDIDLQQCCLSHSNSGATGSTLNLDDKAHLAQNIPNPFNQQTIIKYYLPKDASQAQIRVNDMKGNLLRVVEVYEKGYGQIELEANILAPGTYTYELIVGNERIDTKRMIIQ